MGHLSGAVAVMYATHSFYLFSNLMHLDFCWTEPISGILFPSNNCCMHFVCVRIFHCNNNVYMYSNMAGTTSAKTC